MNSLVGLKIAWVGEPLFAQLARVGFHTQVGHLMLLQIVSPQIAFIAEVALKWFNGQMC